MVRMLLLEVVLTSALVTVGTTLLATAVSRENYPGGVALQTLHRVMDEERGVYHKVCFGSF